MGAPKHAHFVGRRWAQGPIAMFPETVVRDERRKIWFAGRREKVLARIRGLGVDADETSVETSGVSWTANAKFPADGGGILPH